MRRITIDARESGTSTGRYIDKLIEYLYKVNPPLSFTIITKPHRVDFFNQIAPKYTVEVSKYKEFTFGEQIGFKKQIDKLSADLVHFGMVQQPVLYKGKVVTTMHDLTGIRFKNPSKNAAVYMIKQSIYKWVNKRVAKKSDAIITPTEFVKDDVAKFARINSRKITVTLESADKIPDKPEPVLELENEKFIVYVGRPMPHKNLYRLATAFSEVKKKYPKLKLAFVGKKDVVYGEFEKWINDQSIKDVVFTGFVSEGQLRWIYENCEAYVFPSLSEGFGLPPLEAMQHGAPVISSNATCLPEVSGDAAYYFDPEDTEDMKDKINDVLSNSKLRNDLIKKGYEQVKKYSWRRMAEQTIDVYKAVLEETT